MLVLPVFLYIHLLRSYVVNDFTHTRIVFTLVIWACINVQTEMCEPESTTDGVDLRVASIGVRRPSLHLYLGGKMLPN